MVGQHHVTIGQTQHYVIVVAVVRDDKEVRNQGAVARCIQVIQLEVAPLEGIKTIVIHSTTAFATQARRSFGSQLWNNRVVPLPEAVAAGIELESVSSLTLCVRVVTMMKQVVCGGHRDVIASQDQWLAPNWFMSRSKPLIEGMIHIPGSFPARTGNNLRQESGNWNCSH